MLQKKNLTRHEHGKCEDGDTDVGGLRTSENARSQTADVKVGGLARYSLSGMLWLVVDVSCCCDVLFPSSSLFTVQKPMVSWLLFLLPPPFSLSLGSHSISGY